MRANDVSNSLSLLHRYSLLRTQYITETLSGVCHTSLLPSGIFSVDRRYLFCHTPISYAYVCATDSFLSLTNSLNCKPLHLTDAHNNRASL